MQEISDQLGIKGCTALFRQDIDNHVIGLGILVRSVAAHGIKQVGHSDHLTDDIGFPTFPEFGVAASIIPDMVLQGGDKSQPGQSIPCIWCQTIEFGTITE